MKQSENLMTQLQTLPNKVRQPLSALMQAGHIDEHILSDVLDAGKLAGDNSRLLAFSTAYLYLRSKNIPVGDVIHMAKNQGRRVNLGWSAKRWKAEHSRLSRAATLEQLCRSKESYTLGQYQKHLPAKWKGYLIKTSTRLGMEGLRQRHCVAGYHSRILAGSCAFAVVFIAKERWTVQLLLTHNDETPLRVTQINTRLNGRPNDKERRRICEELGIKYEKNTKVQTEDMPQSLYLTNLREVLPVLRQSGVENVTVSFDGSGDEGSIYDVVCTPEIDLGAIEVRLCSTRRAINNGFWEQTVVQEVQSMPDAIEALTYDYLSSTDVDWYNDDGGFGEMIIDVAEGTVSMSIDCRYTESTTEFDRTVDILSGEEVIN